MVVNGLVWEMLWEEIFFGTDDEDVCAMEWVCVVVDEV